MTTPQKYRKRPVTIEAMQWDGTAAGATPIIDWILSNDGTARYHDAVEPQLHDQWCGCEGIGMVPGPAATALPCAQTEPTSEPSPRVPACIVIDTLEGPIRASAGDQVIHGVAGEFYPCKPDIFAETYTAESTANERGFVEMAKVPCRTGGYVQVRESSLATEASFWLDVAVPVDLNEAVTAIAAGTPPEDVPNTSTVIAQLSSDGARALRDQLAGALAQHRFGDLRVDG